MDLDGEEVVGAGGGIEKVDGAELFIDQTARASLYGL